MNRGAKACGAIGPFLEWRAEFHMGKIAYNDFAFGANETPKN